MNAWPGLFAPTHPIVSLAIYAAVALTLLYLARLPVQRALATVARLVQQVLRLGARWLSLNAAELRERNQLVLLAHGREELGQRIEREFERIDAVVCRDLQAYPELQRRLMGEIARMEVEYDRHAQTPPTPPEWTKLLLAIAKVKPGDDPVVQASLASLQGTIEAAERRSMREYRSAVAKRHSQLARMRPAWRGLERRVQSMDSRLKSVERRAAAIDGYMETYQQIQNQSERAEHTLFVSASLLFAVSMLMLMAVIGGVVLDLTLIAPPLAEMVDNSRFIGELPLADVAALGIIFAEAAMGTLLMEATRVTRLFPRISYLSEPVRRALIIAALALLVGFALLQTALVAIYDAASLRIVSDAPGISTADASLIKVFLAFVLPFAMALLPVPLEAFMSSLRTVSGAFLVFVLRSAGFALRLLGEAVRLTIHGLIALYDLVIFLPLLLERAVVGLLRPGVSARLVDDSDDIAQQKR